MFITKELNDSKIEKLVDEVVEEAKRLYPEQMSRIRIHFTISKRMSRSLGVCRSKIRSGKALDHTITFAEALKNCSPEAVRPAVVHEIAHALHPLDHHGRIWYSTAFCLGNKWGIIPSRLSRDPEISKAMREQKTQASQTYKYEVVCPHCGVVIARYKTQCQIVLHPERWRHTVCKTSLISREIKPVKEDK